MRTEKVDEAFIREGCGLRLCEPVADRFTKPKSTIMNRRTEILRSMKR